MIPARMMREREMRPVIEAGAFESSIRKEKTQLSDKMKLGLKTDARAADVAGVGRNFRFN